MDHESFHEHVRGIFADLPYYDDMTPLIEIPRPIEALSSPRSARDRTKTWECLLYV